MTGIFPIPTGRAGRLAILPHPDPAALGPAMADLRAGGAEVLVCLLETAEVQRLGLTGEAAAARAAGLEFIAHPIPDFGVPDDPAAFRGLVTALGAALDAGRGVAVHCRGGIGRSGMLAACLCTGMRATEAMTRVSAARGTPSPETEAQKDMVRRILDARPVT